MGKRKGCKERKGTYTKGTRFGFDKTCFHFMNIVVLKVQIGSEVRKGCRIT
jgi:hypothetical protein